MAMTGVRHLTFLPPAGGTGSADLPPCCT